MELIGMTGLIGIGFVPMLTGLQVISKVRISKDMSSSSWMDYTGDEKIIDI